MTEPSGGFSSVYNLINTARHSIDMTMYELTDTTAEHDLAAAAARGVTVRVILDQNLEKSNNTAAYTYLNANGVPTHWASTTYAATHQKTVTVDGATSAVMSGNLTSQYYSTSRDFAVIENNSLDVKAIEKVFAADYAGTAITPTDGDHLVWSPTDAQSKILAVINGATKSLSVENEEMGYATVVTALENAAKRGVDVEVTMTNDNNEYAERVRRADRGRRARAHLRLHRVALHPREGDRGRLRHQRRAGRRRVAELLQRLAEQEPRAGLHHHPRRHVRHRPQFRQGLQQRPHREVAAPCPALAPCLGVGPPPSL